MKTKHCRVFDYRTKIKKRERGFQLYYTITIKWQNQIGTSGFMYLQYLRAKLSSAEFNSIILNSIGFTGLTAFNDYLKCDIYITLIFENPSSQHS